MKRIDISNISGFKCNEAIILIIDSNGKLFYIHNNINNRNVHFNLPKGVYFSENNLSKCEVYKHKLPKLPKFEVYRKSLKGFNLQMGENPNKCTTDFDKNYMLFDNLFLDLPVFCFVWTLFHEIAHRYYSGGLKSELKCDIFAARKMLERGFNYSQIKLATLLTLTHSQNRQQKLIEIITNLEN